MTPRYPFVAALVKQAFLIAGAVGVFIGGLCMGHFTTTAWSGPRNWFASRKPLESVVLTRLQSELDLTPAQSAQLVPVIDAACSNLRFLSEERRAGRLALLDEVSASIAPVLSPDQQHRLDAFERESRNRPPSSRNQRIAALF